MPESITTYLATGLALGYAILLIFLLLRRREQSNAPARRWLAFTLLAAAGTTLVYSLGPDAHTAPDTEKWFVGDLTQPVLAVIALNLVLILFGGQMLCFLQSRLTLTWTLVGLGWWGTQAALSATTSDTILGQRGWLANFYAPVDVPSAIAFGGWMVIAVVLILAVLYAFYRARLSEIANQALFGMLIIPLVIVGAVLGTTGTDAVAQLGWIVQFTGLAGAVYGGSVYRVFDIRRTMRRATATAIVTVLTGAIFFGLMAVARRVSATSEELYFLLGGLALAAAVAYVPIRVVLQTLTGWLFGGSTYSTSRLLRKFSEDITGVVELNSVVNVTMETLAQVLGVRRGGLIIVGEERHGQFALDPLPHGMGEIPDIQGILQRSSPVFTCLFENRVGLLQYDVDFGSAYTGMPPEEKAFFKQMRMSAYAPVVVHGQPIGILCSGAQSSDDPYTEQDLELLITIANQAGVALRNARLVTDLRRREAEQADLNKDLQTTKEQLEKLDSVKTDFITIASHELRTPLAQIRGYTDIMESMNDQGLLDQDEIAGMTANLSRAADRLEELIAAMLDVSQLGVNAMDLRFTQTSVENTMRMAIEPLTDSIKQRRLMLSARGLRDLPPIQADMQRLVQAFRNIVLNAIKYTPDGGRIDIAGRLEGEHILVTIKDNGIGIDQTNHALIFEKFFRAHDPNLHSTGTTKFMGAGPGLGLTIAKGVIDAHGGTITVASDGYDPDNFPGTTFTIRLPMDISADAPRALPLESSVRLRRRMPIGGEDVVAPTGDSPPAGPSVTPDAPTRRISVHRSLPPAHSSENNR